MNVCNDAYYIISLYRMTVAKIHRWIENNKKSANPRNMLLSKVCGDFDGHIGDSNSRQIPKVNSKE